MPGPEVVRGHIGMSRISVWPPTLPQANLAGIIPGAILSIFALRAAGHFLYGSVTANSFAILAAGMLLAMAGYIATLIPARRACLADPLESLRSE